MYIALLVLLLAVGSALVIKGARLQRIKSFVIGCVVILFTGLFFGTLSFWGEMLWFEELGQTQRFWTAVSAQAGFTALGALVGGLGVLFLTVRIPAETSLARIWPSVIGAIFGGLWGSWNWQTTLKYIYGVATGIRDPILQRDLGFYFFVLPFYDSLYWGLLWIVLIGLAATIHSTIAAQNFDWLSGMPSFNDFDTGGKIPLALDFSIPVAAVTVVVAWGEYLNIYHLMYSRWGVVNGAGWTDVHVRLPAYLIVTAATLLIGFSALVRGVQFKISRQLRRHRLFADSAPLIALILPWLGLFAVWFVVLGVAPVLVQWLRVQPNEITLEAPYISNNIEFTRRAFQPRQGSRT